MARARKEVRVELTKLDLIEAAKSVPGVLNKRTASSATAVRFEMQAGTTDDPSEDKVIAIVTFEFDKSVPVE